MPPVTEQELKQHLQKGAPAPVYLFYGQEQYLVRHYVSQTVKKAGIQNPDFNLHLFDSATSAQDIFDAADAFPLMSDRKCVQVCDFPIDKAPIAEFNKFLSVLQDPNPTTLLVLWFETVEIDPKKPSDRAKKLFKQVEQAGGVVVQFAHRTTGQLVKILCDGAARRQVRLDPTTARYIVETAGSDMTTLVQELEKLCAYVPGGTITREVADALLSPTVESSVFSLSNALLAGDLKKSEYILSDLLFMRVEPVAIVGILAGAYIDIYRCMAISKAGETVSAAAKALGYYNTAFRLENAMRYANRMSPQKIRACLQAISRADGLLKSSRLQPKVVLERLFAELLSKNG